MGPMSKGYVSDPEDTLPAMITSTTDLVAACLALGATDVPGWSPAERRLARAVTTLPDVSGLVELVRGGRDPLGEAFCTLRSAEERRPQGQTYTPAPLVTAMLDWAAAQRQVARVVDPGVGSARYLVAAADRFPRAQLVGVDVDPLAALMARANLAAAGHAGRTRIELVDYRRLELGRVEGRSLFIGNPPYVRHHGLSRESKQWLTTAAARAGLRASQLAGLHVHFFLATLQHAEPGDLGCFVTSSEWLDVNYGSLVRELLTDRLGGRSVHVVAPEAMPFSDATTTAAITCFEVGAPVRSMRLQPVARLGDLGDLGQGRRVARQRLVESSRWSPLLRRTPRLPQGYVELGELARVHRGTVTGANGVWVSDPSLVALPASVLRPSVTKARELFRAGEVLSDVTDLRVVIDLPADLDELEPDDRRIVERFLRRPAVRAARHGYIAANRKAWWSVGLRRPAPILATYMARRPPAFVRNAAEARHINIAHGLYPREPLSAQTLDRLAEHLRDSVTLGQGRTYAGGLTKFEPKEMERLPVPSLELLDS